MESIDTQEGIALDDEYLIAQILSGNKRFYEHIVRKYNARLYRIGMSIINNPTDVEDQMQAAYIQAYQHLHSLEQPSFFGTWLTRIFINACLQFQKKKKQQHMVQNGEENMNKAIAGSITHLPDRALINSELRRVLEDALTQLPEKYRMVFVLREVEDLSISETMSTLDISESNVKVRLNRAKGMLREKLASYYHSDQIYHFHLLRCNNMVNRVLGQLNIL